MKDVKGAEGIASAGTLSAEWLPIFHGKLTIQNMFPGGGTGNRRGRGAPTEVNFRKRLQPAHVFPAS
eukprot:4646011-Amphidinium_carterae.1